MTPRPRLAEFESIVSLIIEARHRAYRKANEELVVLYYNVGRIVSGKVADGAWGKGTVDALAAYIADKNIGLSGFTRRGLYRMKQFYEEYSNPFYPAALRKEHIVTPLASLLKMALLPKVTAAPTLLQNYDNEVNTFRKKRSYFIC